VGRFVRRATANPLATSLGIEVPREFTPGDAHHQRGEGRQPGGV
jgi:hypothetical protein